MLYNQPNTAVENSGTIPDGAVIDAPGVRLTNTDSGRIQGGVRFAQGGSSFVNLLGGIVRPAQGTDPYTSVTIAGSAGADNVINAGLIGGRVALGAGKDVYVARSGTEYGIDLGDDDDLFRLEGAAAVSLVEGGAGQDRIVIAATGASVNGVSVSGFEHVTFETGGSLFSFTGLKSITLASSDPYASYRIYDSFNPTIDLTLPSIEPLPGPFGSSQDLNIVGSSVRSVNGSQNSDRLEFSVATVAGDVRLGSGDDYLVLDLTDRGSNAFAGVVDGGSGIDLLELYTFPGNGAQSVDLAAMIGFERLHVNASYVYPSTTRVSHLSGVTAVSIGQGVMFSLSSSTLTGTNVSGGFGGSVTIEADTTIGRYGPDLAPYSNQDTDIAQGDDLLSTTFVNNGKVVGDVQFYTGDDFYDGRNGTAGGTIYGNAGNDRLLGGAGDELIRGGFGADVIDGGGGADKLQGDAGNDVIRGGSGADILSGGAGNDVFAGTRAELAGDAIIDFAVGDRIEVTDAAYSGAGFTRVGNTLNIGAGQNLTLSNNPVGRLVTSGSVNGQAQLSLANRMTGLSDFDGNGHSDILWREAGGTFSTWNTSGNPQGNKFAVNSTIVGGVSTDWKIQGTFDWDGDGRSDILWRSRNSGEFTIWTGKGDSWAVNAFSESSVGFNWNVAALGDLNGDGKDDIVWRKSSGEFSTWQSTGSGFNANVTSDGSVTANWQIVGLADFDGDGKDDLLWRNPGSGVFSTWTSDGTSFTANTNLVASVDTSWHIDALADFNGDGRDDILWRHDGDGTFTVWQSKEGGAGFLVNTYVNSSVSSVWQVATTGDFNGDGKADILWRNEVSGEFSTWPSNGDGFDPNVALVSGVGTNWQVQGHDFRYG